MEDAQKAKLSAEKTQVRHHAHSRWVASTSGASSEFWFKSIRICRAGFSQNYSLSAIAVCIAGKILEALVLSLEEMIQESEEWIEREEERKQELIKQKNTLQELLEEWNDIG